MCKMIFIATHEVLKEIPFNEDNPNLYLEKIEGEFLPVADKFSNPNIYFIGTSQGCSCDFIIEKDSSILSINEEEIEKEVKNRKSAFDRFRKFTGNFENHKIREIGKAKSLIEKERDFKKQTLQLISLIEENATKQHPVELYCCWAGDYKSPIDEIKKVNLNEVDLKKFVDFELNEKVIYYRD
ncbi:MAG TPA: hypothetical protein VEC36_04260 [Patescibacteria group bacterium]|nr:hypothetical protein [Patescibacteria group bacterium]